MRTKFHFFIRIFIEFPIFDMCFPTFREFIILPTKAYCKTNSYNFLIFFYQFIYGDCNGDLYADARDGRTQ